MFNVEFLHVIRDYEFRRVLPFLEPGSRILEIGGGTGYQARRLTETGFEVVSIDLPDSIYAANREFEVQPYDGAHLPYPDQSFDIVFSSNVLEHIRDLQQINRETARVLKPGGYCVHVMPTGAWRLWTDVAHYVELVQRLAMQAPRAIPRRLTSGERARLRQQLGEMWRTFRHYLVVPRHGEYGNAFTEIVAFGKSRWLREFERHAFETAQSVPVGLFYTGHMVLGARVPLGARRFAARLLGSACRIYLVRPREPAREAAVQECVATSAFASRDRR